MQPLPGYVHGAQPDKRRTPYSNVTFCEHGCSIRVAVPWHPWQGPEQASRLASTIRETQWQEALNGRSLMPALALYLQGRWLSICPLVDSTSKALVAGECPHILGLHDHGAHPRRQMVSPLNRVQLVSHRPP